MMNGAMRTLFQCAAIAIVASFTTVDARAQEEQEELKKIIQQIQADLERLVDEYAKLAAGQPDPATGKAVVEGIDKLLEGVAKDQGDVIDQIDELIKKQKQQQSKSSSQNSQSSGSKGHAKGKKPQSSDARDRNQQPQNEDRGSKPEHAKNDPKNGDPKGGEESDEDPKQSDSGRRPPGSPEEKVPYADLAEFWGELPPETQQLLIESNRQGVYPNYEREIVDYLKSLKKTNRR